MERMLDRTIAFLLANDELDTLPNDTNYLDFSQQSEVINLDRCTMRNIHFLRMNESVAATAEVVAAEVEATDAKLMKTHGAKAQDCIMKKKKKGKKKRVPMTKNLVNIIRPISKK